MWIREVDVPDGLTEAARAGRLVVFVGAGASRDAPADLPDFRMLAAQIAEESGIVASSADLDHPDVLLGRIADRGVDVHQRVAARLGAATSSPNALHGAIVDLAIATKSIRVVTTNYDRHLSTVLASRASTTSTEYRAPALPMGDDFLGIVYLHGSLDQEARHLIVTDGDFGRAYLRDAWAARFLERMFASFTVLFVGYSHGDVVMRYLARSLGPTSERYAMTPDDDPSDWRQLNIKPVRYRVEAQSHGALGESILGWSQILSMGLLDHRQRIAQLVSAPPSQVPEEVSYLETTIRNADTARLFAELARGEPWLLWAASQPGFRLLFDPTAVPTDASLALAYWFAEHYVSSEDHSSAALEVMREAGGCLSSFLWHAIGWQLHVREAPRPPWLQPWLLLLIENAPIGGRDWLEYALVASSLPDDRDTAVLLFEHLTDPHVHPESAFGLGGAPRFAIKIRGDGHWLREAWTTNFLPNLDELARTMLIVAERQIHRAHQLLSAAGAATTGWDPVSFGRSSIAPHGQDRHSDDFGIVIDAARDCADALIRVDLELATSYARAWTESDVPILRRLALYIWTRRPDVGSREKLAWLDARGWLFDHQLRHEVFELLASALPDAPMDMVESLVATAIEGPQDVEDAEAVDYERFNLLAWLNDHSDQAVAQAAFESIKAKHPEFAVREHPDLLSWSEVGTVGAQPPMSVDELHALIETDVANAIAKLRSLEHARSPWEGSTWYDAIALLAATVKAHPDDGFLVLDTESGGASDVAQAAIRGWAAAVLTDEVAEAVLGRIAQLKLHEVVDEVTRMLSGGNAGDGPRTEWHRYETARELASAIWDALEAAPVPDGIDDWLGRAINTPAGRLAEFWTHAVASDWKAAGDDWTGLSTPTRLRLEELLVGDDDRHAMAQVVLSSQVHFFFGADREWCEARVLPLFDWSDSGRAHRTWDGFLSWGRWNDQLLAAGLLEGYLVTAEHLDSLRDELRRQLAHHLGSVAVYSQVEPLEWVRRLTRAVEEEFRVEWLRQVSRDLGRLPPDAVEEQWQRWLRAYWRGRLDSVPLALTTAESSAMAEWPLHLGESLSEAVEFALQHRAGLQEHGGVLHDLKDRVISAPQPLARLLAHLLSGTELPFWGCHDLKDIFLQLSAEGDAADVRRIREEATRLGCLGASGW